MLGRLWGRDFPKWELFVIYIYIWSKNSQKTNVARKNYTKLMWSMDTKHSFVFLSHNLITHITVLCTK